MTFLSSLHHTSNKNLLSLLQRLLILLLLTIGNAGNSNVSRGSGAGVVSAQQDSGSASRNGNNNNGYYEQVLHSNPQFYSLQDNNNNVTSNDQADESIAEEIVGLLFNIRSKLSDEDEEDATRTIYITGFEFYTSISGTIYYQLFSRDGPYYDTPEGANGGIGIKDWDPLVDDDEVSGGWGVGAGWCDMDELKMEYRDKLELGTEGGESATSTTGGLFGDNDGIDAADVAKSSPVAAPSCPLSTVPRNKFTISSYRTDDGRPWTLNGPNATRSFYLTLASKHLLAASHPRYISPEVNITENPPSFDSQVIASNQHLEIYEGVAAKTYPLDLDTSHYYNALPMGFIGKIHYYVEGSDPTPAPSPAPIADGMTKSPVAVEVGMTLAPSEGGTSLAPTETGQTRAPVVPGFPTSIPTGSPTLNPTRAATQPPTPRPTRRCRPGRPCLPPPPPPAPPTVSPTPAPAQVFTVELMVYVENVPYRRMSNREENEYVEILLKFMEKNGELKRNDVEVRDLMMFWHDVYEQDEEQKKGSRKKRKNGLGSSHAAAEEKNETDKFTYHFNDPVSQAYEPEVDEYPKGYGTVYVMTKVEIFTKLPFDVAAFFLWDQLKDGEDTLVRTYKANSIFVSYFRDMTGIRFEVVDDLTRPPTPAPTFPKDEDELAAAEAEEAEAKAAERRNIYTWVGIIIALLWGFLMLCGFRSIFKYRHDAYGNKKLAKQRTLKRNQSMYRKGRGRLSKVGKASRLPGAIGGTIGDTFRRGLSIDSSGHNTMGKKKKKKSRRRSFLGSSRGGLDGAEMAELVSDADSSTAEGTSRRTPKVKNPKKNKKAPPTGSKRVSFADRDFD